MELILIIVVHALLARLLTYHRSWHSVTTDNKLTGRLNENSVHVEGRCRGQLQLLYAMEAHITVMKQIF